jgi:hypothetical protein
MRTGPEGRDVASLDDGRQLGWQSCFNKSCGFHWLTRSSKRGRTAFAARLAIAIRRPQCTRGAASLRLANARIGYEVLASGALADRTVVAVASNALVSAMDPAPRFELSKSATVHMEDTSPAQLASVGTPNTVAAPMRSMFQSDSSALRLIMEVSWGLRTSGAVAWMQNVNW